MMEVHFQVLLTINFCKTHISLPEQKNSCLFTDPISKSIYKQRSDYQSFVRLDGVQFLEQIKVWPYLFNTISMGTPG